MGPDVEGIVPQYMFSDKCSSTNTNVAYKNNGYRGGDQPRIAPSDVNNQDTIAKPLVFMDETMHLRWLVIRYSGYLLPAKHAILDDEKRFER